ncbi:MAG TPA: alpha/beta fold hydrolase [Xanthobacteraceae bacterium]|nr:alpha/beta fold hydrolase [Xanthobacteraceae bacterium]
MPYATTRDNVRLYYEEAGSGTPILFIHEFAGDHRNWEQQVRYFARRHRCIAYSARGYKPSDVPSDPKAYSYNHWIGDAIAVLDHLKIEKAHIVGLSMGGYTTVLIGVHFPQRALSLTAAGAGSGSERHYTEEFRRGALALAEQFEKEGAAAVARSYGFSPARIPFLVKDPRGFEEFNRMFAEHDAQGSAHTMRNFQAVRPSLYDFEAEIRRITVPTLIIVGDEDDPCLEPSLKLKQWIAPSGLAVFPKTGHVVNQEEPALFNQTVGDFIARVEAGRWPPRDERSLRK